MAAKRDALSESLDTLASDLRSLFETLVHDPKEQARKERLWRALYGVTGALFTLAARRLATKAWSILTGEEPPIKQARKPSQQPRPESVTVPEQPERETTPTGSS